MVRVTFSGEGLRGFGQPVPSAHIKIFFPEGNWTPHSDAPRPPSRTYTPLAFDPAKNELEVEFVLHGAGLAADWVRRARRGDVVYIGGPRGGFQPAHDLREIVILCDDTALPAATMIVRALSTRCNVKLVAEVGGEDEARDIDRLPASRIEWLVRDDRQPCGTLVRRLADLTAADDAFWWVACEAKAMRKMRSILLERGNIAKERLITRGYWQAGETNHPDHDYGV